ncbi:hypothetical protein MVEN_01015800 [Mycena venus]|uniref:Uncharacterized protein n=1 Tax=Mycena venus TaxID=2733690 RepID=A0A8H6Y9E4_9AGAR|nr:hypothetical protein MVEN_01015800 [Mycena venus]
MFSKLISAVALTVLAGRALAADPIVTINTFNVTIGPDGKHSTLVLPPPTSSTSTSPPSPSLRPATPTALWPGMRLMRARRTTRLATARTP